MKSKFARRTLALFGLVIGTLAPTFVVAGPWSYETRTDKMTTAKNRFARTDSVNTLRLPFPYEGPTRGRITIRDREGLDVYIHVSQGQILCTSYDGCSVLIKFDDEPPETYGATGASDHDPKYVFLDEPAKFVEKARSAKRIMVRFEMFQAGEQTLTFSVPKPLVFTAE